MQRRTLLKVGLTSGALLAVVGGAAAMIKPGFERGVLTQSGREVFRAIGLGVLDKTLPEPAAEKNKALDSLLDRISTLIAGLPELVQAEVSQLLSLLHSSAGRYALAGLNTPWLQATPGEVQAALQDMRLSSLAVRQQAYAALHDIASGAYFSSPDTWPLLGYPGPLKI